MFHSNGINLPAAVKKQYFTHIAEQVKLLRNLSKEKGVHLHLRLQLKPRFHSKTFSLCASE